MAVSMNQLDFPETDYAAITQSVHDQAVETVIAQMRADVSFPFTLETFAEMANYSPFHFARLFRQTVGSPPGEFLAALRFEKAKQLILRTDMSITDVCFEVGFSSLGTFSARFKHLVGLSPVELRTMPELLAERLADLDNLGMSKVARKRKGINLCGEVTSPRNDSGHLFIGLFPAAIPQSSPVSGNRIPGPGVFTLPNVPFGSYRLLAAMFPLSADPLDHLLPGNRLQVGSDPKPVVVSPDEPPRLLSLELRTAQPTDPPILTALAPMVLGLKSSLSA